MRHWQSFISGTKPVRYKSADVSLLALNWDGGSRCYLSAGVIRLCSTACWHSYMVSQLLLAWNCLACCKGKGGDNCTKTWQIRLLSKTLGLWKIFKGIRGSWKFRCSLNFWKVSLSISTPIPTLCLSSHLRSTSFICAVDGLLWLNMYIDCGPSICTGHQELSHIERQTYHSTSKEWRSEVNWMKAALLSTCSLHWCPRLVACHLSWCLHSQTFSYAGSIQCLLGTCCGFQCTNDKLLFWSLFQNYF